MPRYERFANKIWKIEYAMKWMFCGLLLGPALCVPAFSADADMRSASLKCSLSENEQQVICDYRHAATLLVKNVSLKVGGQAVQISVDKGLTAYPATDQTTAILFLVDASDPRRKNTVEKKNAQAVTAMLAKQQPHHRVGLAVFDSEMQVLAPIGADAGAMKSAVSNIKAIGQATELYKNLLSAIALLKKTEATRRGLIIMSDGKDEDRAYKHIDVVKAAHDAGVVIMGLGYLETPTDSPHLQTLKRLADETYGQYFDATNHVLPLAIEGKPFAFAEMGGRVTFDAGAHAGTQEITVILGVAEGKASELKASVEFPEKRTRGHTIEAPVFVAGADTQSASLKCSMADNGSQVICDYRHAATLLVKDVSLKVGGQAVQIPADRGLTVYPAAGQKTALLFLVGVSDPRRRNTVEKKNVEDVTAMLANQQPHHKVGLAVFDSELRVLAPIGSDASAMKSAVSNIKAGGQASEFYKNIISAIALLKTTEATRRGLIVMSDGKDEDRAYTHIDVVKAAHDAGVVIMGLGYQEKSTVTPYLQALKRLADETYGQYFDATNHILPLAIEGKPFAFAEMGGRVTFDAGAHAGTQEITVILGVAEGKAPELKASVEFPDKRTREQRVIDFGKEFWGYLLAGFGILVLITVMAARSWRRRKAAKPPTVEYAYLDEMDGLGTRHVITKTAVRIGRGAGNDIRLANDSISSHHAEFHRKREGVFYVVDLASANGVYVNDKKVSQNELRNGDLIELGDVRLRYSQNSV